MDGCNLSISEISASDDRLNTSWKRLALLWKSLQRYLWRQKTKLRSFYGSFLSVAMMMFSSDFTRPLPARVINIS
jgi:hypothetical protein